MNDIDSLLNSVGINPTINTIVNQPAPPIQQPSPHEDTPEPENLTDDDFDEILRSNGFGTIPDEGDGSDTLGLQREAYDALIEAIDNGTINLENGPEEESVEGEPDDEEETEEEETPDEDTGEEIVQEHHEEPVIPLNSPTLLLDDSTSRFSGTEWYRAIQNSRIILAGLGGIGSWAALQLARLHPTVLFLYDDDTVETSNMSGQLYKYLDAGNAKVNAMADMILDYTSTSNVIAVPEKFTHNTAPGDIMICGFDNMDARRTFYYSWKERLISLSPEGRHKCLFIDGRLSIDTLQVICIPGDEDYYMELYEREYLFSSDEADETVCSLKQTSYMAGMIGSVIVNLFTNWTANLLGPVIPYDLPFFTEYDSQHMIFKKIK